MVRSGRTVIYINGVDFDCDRYHASFRSGQQITEKPAILRAAIDCHILHSDFRKKRRTGHSQFDCGNASYKIHSSRMFKVRPARIADAHTIAYVQVESWKSTYAGIVPDTYLASLSPESRTDSWKQQFDGATLILVAEDEAGVFGFVSGGALRDQIVGYDAELYAIYLLQQKQREGVGRALVKKLADALRGKGYRSLIVWVLERNPSLGFYTRLGGTAVLTKEIKIGGAQLTEVALGWSDIADLS